MKKLLMILLVFSSFLINAGGAWSSANPAAAEQLVSQLPPEAKAEYEALRQENEKLRTTVLNLQDLINKLSKEYEELENHHKNLKLLNATLLESIKEHKGGKK